MDTSARNLFGMASTTAYLRSLALALTPKSRSICEAMSAGFGLGQIQGSNLFLFYRNQSGLSDTVGFGAMTYYANYELDVQAIIDKYLPLETVQGRQVLTVCAHAIVWSYYLSTAIPIDDVVKYIGKVLYQASILANNNPSTFTLLKDGTVVHPFTADVLRGLIQKKYSSVITELSSSPKQGEAPLVNYNWYDTNTIMAGPDLQIMKDIENQYYYVSGIMLFQADGAYPTCIEDTISINTPTGKIISTYIRNAPCVDPETYIGPPTNVKFNRIFNDGPSSSGVFTAAVKQAYVDFDKHILSVNDWSGNAIRLFTYETGDDGQLLPVANWAGKTFCDANGRYDLDVEWKDFSDTDICSGVIVRMHVGDERPKTMGLFSYTDNGMGGYIKTCTGTYQNNSTGFKFVSLELPEDEFNQNLTYYKLNPPSAVNNVLKRALSLDVCPYIASENEPGILAPVSSDGYSNWYIGPPQLSGGNTLPTLAFFQNFDSQTFSEGMGIMLYPTLSRSYGTTNDSTSRSYDISPIPLLSGTGLGHIRFDQPSNQRMQFSTTISSNLSGYDEIYHQFFGMGDAMSGQFNVQTYSGNNAGFSYTGYLVRDDSGNLVNVLTTITNYDQYLLGSRCKTIKYISGYRDFATSGILPISKIAAQSSSGTKEYYYYLDGRVVSGSFPDNPYDPISWTYMAPLPYQMDSYYERVYAEQKVENYFPRYSHGPFSVETRKFLYPHAKQMDNTYVFKWNGFPAQVTFDIEVREEAVKEIYCTYQILPDRSITSAHNIEVLRANKDNGDYLVTTFMSKIWTPNADAYKKEYDLNSLPVNEDFEYFSPFNAVDNDYAPTDNYGTQYANYPPSGKHSFTMNGFSIGTLNNNLFRAGIYQTGWGAIQHAWITGSNVTENIPFFTEANTSGMVGLYHGYRSFGQSLTLNYVPPIFDLSTAQIEVSDALLQAFPVQSNMIGMPMAMFSGGIDTVLTGKDPIFNEFVGGRTGGPTAIQEGGYHSKGIVGDKWMGMATHNINRFSSGVGIYSYFCGYNIQYRKRPDYDDQVMLFNSTQTGTEVWMNGMAFSPFMANKTPVPALRESQTYAYVFNGITGVLPTTFKSGFMQFDLSTFFPMQSGSGWYVPSGLTIGPFDRDIELGVLYPSTVVAQNQLFINGTKYADSQSYGDCPFDYIRDKSVVSGLNPRNFSDQNYTIVTRIQAGKKVNLNVYNDSTGVGIQTHGYMVLRASNLNWQSRYDSNIHMGEEAMLDPLRYVNNGTEKRIVLPHNNGFQDLANTYEFKVYSHSGLCYPIPDSIDFQNRMSYLDDHGNRIYPFGSDVQTYWQNIAAETEKPVTMYGWREGSRMSIVIKNVKVTFDKIPYQEYKFVAPSGQCTISGEFGYHAQADNGVFTEGIHIENITPNDPIAELWNPIYISDVLSRMPNFIYPSGTDLSPVLPAPSSMMQRLYPSGIAKNQLYLGLLTYPPDNYNKLLWPTLSDLESLNKGETLEELPPDDGQTFLLSNLMFSAAQGQPLPNGSFNPKINKQYGVKAQYQMYDSVATDALTNSGTCMTTKRGRKNVLSQEDMSGIMAPMSSTLTSAIKGLI